MITSVQTTAATTLILMVCKIASAPFAASAPKTATPTAPATCLTVFKAAEPVPESVLSTLERIPVVIAGTASPIPKEISKKGTDNCQNDVCIPAVNRPEKPNANSVKPSRIGVRIP